MPSSSSTSSKDTQQSEHSSNSDEQDLTQGSLIKHIFRLALPMIFGIMAVFSVSIVDTYFVGQLGTMPLAALSFTFPVTMAIASLASGLGAGASSMVSRATGADEADDAKRYATDSLLLATVFVIIISALGYATITPLFTLLGADENILPLIRDYMEVWYISMPFLVIPIVANAIIRSLGNALWPSIIMFITALINVILTPLFINGFAINGYFDIPAMEIRGAAVATTIARISTFVLALYVAIYREKIVLLCRPSLAVFVKSAKSVLQIALPAGAGSIVNPIGIGIVTAVLAAYGAQTVAAFGVATRIESFACIPMLALSAVVGPIVGQNWGAGQTKRVLRTLQFCYLLCIVWTLMLALVFYLFAENLTIILASNQEVADISTQYLYVVALSLVGFGWIIVSSAAFNALGRSISGLSFYIVRSFIFYVPLSVLASLWAESEWVFIAIAVSNLGAGILVASYAMFWLKKAKRNDTEPNWRLQSEH